MAHVCQLLRRISLSILGDERRAEWVKWSAAVQTVLHTDCSRAQLGQLGEVAASQAKAIAKADAASAAAAFKSWLHDGPSAGLGRQHRITRPASGGRHPLSCLWEGRAMMLRMLRENCLAVRMPSMWSLNPALGLGTSSALHRCRKRQSRRRCDGVRKGCERLTSVGSGAFGQSIAVVPSRSWPWLG